MANWNSEMMFQAGGRTRPYLVIGSMKKTLQHTVTKLQSVGAEYQLEDEMEIRTLRVAAKWLLMAFPDEIGERMILMPTASDRRLWGALYTPAINGARRQAELLTGLPQNTQDSLRYNIQFMTEEARGWRDNTITDGVFNFTAITDPEIPTMYTNPIASIGSYTMQLMNTQISGEALRSFGITSDSLPGHMFAANTNRYDPEQKPDINEALEFGDAAQRARLSPRESLEALREVQPRKYASFDHFLRAMRRRYRRWSGDDNGLFMPMGMLVNALKRHGVFSSEGRVADPNLRALLHRQARKDTR